MQSCRGNASSLQVYFVRDLGDVDVFKLCNLDGRLDEEIRIELWGEFGSPQHILQTRR